KPLLNQPGKTWVRAIQRDKSLIGLDRASRIIGLDQGIACLKKRERCDWCSWIFIHNLTILGNGLFEGRLRFLRTGSSGQNVKHRFSLKFLSLLRCLSIDPQHTSDHSNRKEKYPEPNEERPPVVLKPQEC